MAELARVSSCSTNISSNKSRLGHLFNKMATKISFLLVCLCFSGGRASSCTSNLPEPGNPRGNGKIRIKGDLQVIFSFSIFAVGYYCENKMAKIRCPHNRFLHIKYADYGRVDNTQCRDPMFEEDSSEMNPDVPCRSNVRNIIKAK